MDLTSELYASSFSLDGQYLRFLHRKARVQSAFSYFINMLPPIDIITEQDPQVAVYLSELRVTEGVITLYMHRTSTPGKPHGVALLWVELHLPQVGPMLE